MYIIWVTERFLGSQEGICSVDWVI